MTEKTYEVAVYEEDCDRLTLAVFAACEEAAKIPDQRIRAAIIGSALFTAAQLLDGNRMPDETEIVKLGGVAAALCHIVKSKQ